jgi:predicted secreted protein
MSRPTRFEEHRYLGDKRKQVVYDLDADDAEVRDAVAELLESEQFAAFAPDTLAEARNRGYRPHASIHSGGESDD